MLIWKKSAGDNKSMQTYPAWKALINNTYKFSNQSISAHRSTGSVGKSNGTLEPFVSNMAATTQFNLFVDGSLIQVALALN